MERRSALRRMAATFELPGSDIPALALLEPGSLPTRAGLQGQLVVEAPNGVWRPDIEEDVTASVDRILPAVHVESSAPDDLAPAEQSPARVR